MEEEEEEEEGWRTFDLRHPFFSDKSETGRTGVRAAHGWQEGYSIVSASWKKRMIATQYGIDLLVRG